MHIDKDKVEEISLTYGIWPPTNFSFPGKIKASSSILGTESLDYIPLKYCVINVTIDDDCIVGHSECSECNHRVDVSINYCPYCGAKVRGKYVKEPTVVIETIHMDILDQTEENSDAEQ